MSGEQRAMLAQLQQSGQLSPQSAQGGYPSMGNPILGLQIPQLQKFAEQYPQVMNSPYVIPFYREHKTPYDWSKLFQASQMSKAAPAPAGRLPLISPPTGMTMPVNYAQYARTN